MSSDPTTGDAEAACGKTFDQGLVACEDGRIGTVDQTWVCDYDRLNIGFEGYGWQCLTSNSFCPAGGAKGGLDIANRQTGYELHFSCEFCY
jgi:hypothetical protein